MPHSKKRRPARKIRRQGALRRSPDAVAREAESGLEQVERILQDAVSTAAEVFGESHPHYATALEHLASYLHGVGREQEATAALAKRSSLTIDPQRWRTSSPGQATGPAFDLRPAVLDLREAARYLAISPDTLYKLVRSGEIPHTRVGKSIRFRPVDLDRFLEERTSREWMRLDARGRPRRLS